MMVSGNWLHLCIDMQRMFAEETPWQVPWMDTVLSAALEVADRFPARTVFTRFVPPVRAEDVRGRWQDYYRKWETMTLDRLDPALVDLVPELQRLVPPARIFDKPTYSPWVSGELDRILRREGVTTIAISGGETDVCVLSAVLGAIDLGYAVTVLRDAVCSGADETHDASLSLLGERFSVQVDVIETARFLDEAARFAAR